MSLPEIPQANGKNVVGRFPSPGVSIEET